MKNAFLRPFTIKKNVFWVSKNQISMKKMSVFLTTSLISTFSLFPCLIPWCFSFTQPWEKSWPIHPCTEATDSFYLTIALHYGIRAMRAMTLRISDLCLSFFPHPNNSDGNFNLVSHFIGIEILQIDLLGPKCTYCCSYSISLHIFSIIPQYLDNWFSIFLVFQLLRS